VLIQRNTINEKIRYIKMLEKNLEEMKNKIVVQDDESFKSHKTELNKLETLLNEKVEQLAAEFEGLKK
jgi:hypothetical protein